MPVSININDESGYKYLIEVILITLCVLFFYNGTQAQSKKSKQLNYISNGSLLLSVPESEESEVMDFNLKQNEPNPVLDSTFISYYLPEKCRVVLELYNDRIENIAH